ncbi:ABC transporter transmembrane domain-containing protein [Streptomyces sp. NPDC005017]|uniref:ABC transporter transmembrane domain-containing protein n=1 Tax=Streptomyces sp. NPDC005017 TaxID=3364706 RepID=UPI0036C3CA63
MIDAYEDPGTPDHRGGWRYLWWLVLRQPGRSVAGAVLGSAWMVLLSATPYLMARAVDEGLVPGDLGALAVWTGALVAAGAFNAWLGIMRHRTMTRVRMDANFRTVKVVVGHAVRLGAALPRRIGTGEVMTIGVGDVAQISGSLTVVGPGFGAVVAYGVVAGLLLSVSGQLAAVVLLGVPVLVVLVGPLMGRLQGTETEYRERQGVLTARIGDLAGGLRVLNGLGGKDLFARAFRADSARLREQGYRVGAVTSWMQALGIGLPTLFLAVVTWLAARLAAQGAITVGELVAVYGYVAVLVRPVAFLLECGYQLGRGVVAARHVVRLLRLEPDPDTGTTPAPAEPSVLHDPDSGVRVRPGRLTALAAEHPADAVAVTDRLARYEPSAATWGDILLSDIPLAQIRSRILLATPDADLFAGPLRDVIDARTPPSRSAGPYRPAAPPQGAAPTPPHPGRTPPSTPNPQRGAGPYRPAAPPQGADSAAGRQNDTPPSSPTPQRGAGNCATSHDARSAANPQQEAPPTAHPRPQQEAPPTAHPRPQQDALPDARLHTALNTAAAEDILHALPAGLDSPIDAQATNLSGGQRQRVRLARALLHDPEVLIAVEPTSALDAHTEAQVADRLRTGRAGRTTVVTTTSPLVLDRADTVHYLVDGKVAASGTHARLLAEEPGYRALVSRDATEETAEEAAANPVEETAATEEAVR